MKNPKIGKMIGSFVIELIIYSILVVAYFFAVLRLLGGPLYHLYSSNGIVADEILREGRIGDYDLIVLGSSRAAGGIVRALMGDLAREIVTRAERPVLVVRPTD